MTATPFEKLTAMWQSGEINDDEFKLATQYLREEQAKLGAHSARVQHANDSCPGSDQSLATQLARLLLPRATLDALAPWQRYLVEIGLFVAVAGVGVWLIGQLFVMLVTTDILKGKNLHPVGAALWTVILLATGGVFVGYNRLALGIISVPLFLVLLLSPLWKSPDDNGSSSKVYSVTAYERPISAGDYGAEWPFPNYSGGTLRCERKTVSGVTRSLITIELGGRVYGLNGAATGWGGYDDSRRLMAKHPEWGTYELGASDTMITDALSRCG